MSDLRSIDRPGEICPYLGIADDPAVRCLGASSFHRCHCDSRPRLIGTAYQNDFCVSGAYRECSRWDGTYETSSVVEGVGYLFGWDGRLLRRAARRATQFLGTGLIALAWMALSVTAIVLLAPLLTAANPGARAETMSARDISASAARTETAADRPESVASPPLQVEPSPAITETANLLATTAEGSAETALAPIAVPTAEPSPTQSPPDLPPFDEKRYVVQKKDTLWSLAKAHGVTVEDIMKANGLGNRDYIRAGETIIIPQE